MFHLNRRTTTLVTVSLLLAVLVLFHSSSTTNALSCWQCNSEKQSFCEKVPEGPVSNVSQLEKCFQELYKECVSDNAEITYTFCRKQEQSIDGKKRVIRSCGFERSLNSDCYQTRNQPILTTVCQCDGDGCNGAGQMGASVLALIGSLALFRFVAW